MNHISIEGIDGVGKTTTCLLLAEKAGYEFVDKNLRFLFDAESDYKNYLFIRDKVNAGNDNLLMSWFYGLENIYLHTFFESKNIITENYFLANYVLSGTKENTKVYDVLVKKLGFPMLTVILYLDENLMAERFEHRNKSDIEKVKNSKEKYEKMIYFCEKYKLPYMVIDVGNLTPEQTVEIILKRIERA